MDHTAHPKYRFWLLFAAAACAIVAVCFLMRGNAAKPAAGAPEMAQTLDAAFSQAILADGKDVYHPTDFQAEAHRTLGTSDGGTGRVTVYAIVYYEEYYQRENGAFSASTGYCYPEALTFSVENGQYKLLEHRQPEDGSSYESSIRKEFPVRLVPAALTSSGQAGKLQAECRAKAEAHFKNL